MIMDKYWSDEREKKWFLLLLIETWLNIRNFLIIFFLIILLLSGWHAIDVTNTVPLTWHRGHFSAQLSGGWPRVTRVTCLHCQWSPHTMMRRVWNTILWLGRRYICTDCIQADVDKYSNKSLSMMWYQRAGWFISHLWHSSSVPIISITPLSPLSSPSLSCMMSPHGWPTFHQLNLLAKFQQLSWPSTSVLTLDVWGIFPPSGVKCH